MPQSPAIASAKLVTAHIELTSQDEGDIALRDEDAEKYGPLTKDRLDAERKKMIFDPKFPRRPLRILPIGKVEEDTSDFKDFRKYAYDNDIMVTIKSENPKLKGTPSWKRYERYKMAKTLREVVELSLTGKTSKERMEQLKKARDDITWDAVRGFIPSAAASAAAIAMS